MNVTLEKTFPMPASAQTAWLLSLTPTHLTLWLLTLRKLHSVSHALWLEITIRAGEDYMKLSIYRWSVHPVGVLRGLRRPWTILKCIQSTLLGTTK